MRANESARNRGSGERGQSTLLMLALVTVMVAIGAALMGLGRVSRDQARAQAVADLVALAGVDGGDDPGEIALANGARVVSVVRRGAAVEVVVERQGIRASAAAEPDARLGAQ